MLVLSITVLISSSSCYTSSKFFAVKSNTVDTFRNSGMSVAISKKEKSTVSASIFDKGNEYIYDLVIMNNDTAVLQILPEKIKVVGIEKELTVKNLKIYTQQEYFTNLQVKRQTKVIFLIVGTLAASIGAVVIYNASLPPLTSGYVTGLQSISMTIEDLSIFSSVIGLAGLSAIAVKVYKTNQKNHFENLLIPYKDSSAQYNSIQSYPNILMHYTALPESFYHKPLYNGVYLKDYESLSNFTQSSYLRPISLQKGESIRVIVMGEKISDFLKLNLQIPLGTEVHELEFLNEKTKKLQKN